MASSIKGDWIPSFRSPKETWEFQYKSTCLHQACSWYTIYNALYYHPCMKEGISSWRFFKHAFSTGSSAGQPWQKLFLIYHPECVLTHVPVNGEWGNIFRTDKRKAYSERRFITYPNMSISFSELSNTNTFLTWVVIATLHSTSNYWWQPTLRVIKL